MRAAFHCATLAVWTKGIAFPNSATRTALLTVACFSRHLQGKSNPVPLEVFPTIVTPEDRLLIRLL